MRQKHAFYDLAKNRLVNRLTRILGAYRLGNITMAEALEQSETAFRTAMREINRYTVEVQAKRDLGETFKPLSPRALRKLEGEIQRKQKEFEAILKDAKT
jgi:hypothetical protein